MVARIRQERWRELIQPFLYWFDTGRAKPRSRGKGRIDWIRALPFVAMCLLDRRGARRDEIKDDSRNIGWLAEGMAS